MQIHRQTNENKVPSLVTYNNELKMNYRLPSPEDLASWYRRKAEIFPSSFLLSLLDISCSPYPFFCDALLSPRTTLYQDSQLLYLAETQANDPFPSLHSPFMFHKIYIMIRCHPSTLSPPPTPSVLSWVWLLSVNLEFRVSQVGLFAAPVRYSF